MIVKPYENQGGIEILTKLLHVFGVVLCCLSFVYGVEGKARVFVLDRLEVHLKGLLDAV